MVLIIQDDHHHVSAILMVDLVRSHDGGHPSQLGGAPPYGHDDLYLAQWSN
jgi:hypothetical protein